MAIHSNETQKIDTKTIAGALEVPLYFLAKILQQLSKHNLVSSVKGPGGGFYLSEQNLEIPLQKVVESIDGEDIFQKCIIGLPNCDSENPCPLHNEYTQFREDLSKLLKHQTIKEVAENVDLNGIRF